MSELRDWDGDRPGVGDEPRSSSTSCDRAHAALLPSGRRSTPTDAVTDETRGRASPNSIREAALEGVSDELPHSLAVTIDDMVERDDDELIEIYANLCVERDSQKGIVIGKGGARLQDVGPPRAPRSRSSSAPRCSCDCASRSRRSGSATRSSSGGWGSSQLPIPLGDGS